MQQSQLWPRCCANDAANFDSKTSSPLNDSQKTNPMQTVRPWSGIALLLLVNLLATSFLYSPGTNDTDAFFEWMDLITKHGQTYADLRIDYPPLALAMLTTVSRCAHVLGITPFIALKGSLLLFLFATAGCFYYFTRHILLTAALEFTLLLNSIALGYLDIYFAPFLIAGLFNLQRQNLHRGILLFAVACFIKWQPLIIAPFVCIYVLTVAKDGSSRPHKVWMRVLPFATAAGVIVIPIVAVFGWNVIYCLQQAMTHPLLSGYALNLSWLHTWALHLAHPEKFGPLRDGLIRNIYTPETFLKLPERILFYTSYCAILILFVGQKKKFERLIIYSMLGYMSYFICNTGVHENHLFLVAGLAWVLAFVDSSQLLRCINLSIAANANLILFYGVFGRPFPFTRVIAGIDVTLWFAIINICLFVGFLMHTLKTDGLPVRFRHTPKDQLRVSG
jgi:hypothetical protein